MRGADRSLPAQKQVATWRVAGVQILILFGVFFFALWGCRTPVDVEGNLSVEPFERRLASLTQDPGGQWYVVAIRGHSPGPYLTVEYEGEKHLFVTGDRGERSARILPLTRPDPQWMEKAYEGSPRLEFHDRLRHQQGNSTLGKWQGGDVDEVRWLGPKPTKEMRAVALPLTQSKDEASLPSVIAGVVVIDGDGISEMESDISRNEGPYLLIPDGPVSEFSPRVLSLVDDPAVNEELEGWELEELEERDVASAADIGELAGRHSVEAVIARQGDDLRMGFSTDSGAPRRGVWSRTVALAESGFLVDGEAEKEIVHKALQAIDDLYRDHPLSAAYRLEQIGDRWSVEENPKATELRHQDLVAAAGYTPWMRAVFVDSADGLGPEVSLFLARAYAYGGHWEAVRGYANRAIELFSKWPPKAGAMGMGRARLLMADTHFATGQQVKGGQALKEARDDFLRAGDDYRVALVRRQLLWKEKLDDVDAVVRQLDRAGASYEARRTLLLAAAEELGHGELEAADGLLRDWADQFLDPAAEEVSARLRWLYFALMIRLDWLQGYAVGEEIAEWETESERSRAWEAMLTFALTQHEWRAMHDESDLERLGRVLVEGRKRSYSDIFAPDIDRNLAVICTDLVFSQRMAQDQWLDSYCEAHLESTTEDVAGVISLLEGGYRFIQRAELGAARRLEAFILDALADERWPAARAKVYLYEAALAEDLRPRKAQGAPDEDVVDALQRAFDILDDHLPSEKAPKMLMELGDLFDLRGMDRIALSLYGAAVDAAADAELDREVFDSSLEYARACHRAEAWEELAAMDNVESPLHAARIDLYRGHAQVMRGEKEEGEAVLKAVLRSIEEFGALQMLGARELAARLAMERDDVEEARLQLGDAYSAIEELPDGLMGRQEAMAIEAGLMITEAWIHTADGDIEKGHRRALEAIELISEVDEIKLAGKLELRAYEVAIDTANRREQRKELITALADRSRLWAGEEAARIRRDASRLLVQYDLEDTRSGRAMERIQSVLGEGLGVRSNRRQHHCTIAEAMLYAGEIPDQLHLERCKDGPQLAEAVRVGLLSALATPEPELFGYRVELARHLVGLTPSIFPAEQERLQWLVEFSTDEVEDEESLELKELFLQSRAGVDADEQDEESEWTTEERLDAAFDYLTHLIKSGRFADAEQQLSDADRAGRWYFRNELDAEDLWMVLRIRLAVQSLQPFAALDYLEEAFEHAPPTTEERAVKLHYYRAVAHLQLRQTGAAAMAIEKARQYLDSDSEAKEKIDELESVVRPTRSGR